MKKNQLEGSISPNIKNLVNLGKQKYMFDYFYKHYIAYAHISSLPITTIQKRWIWAKMLSQVRSPKE